jgi:serine/threonine protein kinase
MHYCEAGTIASVISSAKKNKSTLAENQVIKWVLQLALAMQFLHDYHVIHRDLKPMNVMLTEGGDSLKLADFGLAMSMSELSQEDATDEVRHCTLNCCDAGRCLLCCGSFCAGLGSGVELRHVYSDLSAAVIAQ